MSSPAERRAYLNEWRRKRKAAGLCWICGDSLKGSGSSKTCARCFPKERERVRDEIAELTKRRFEAGLCVTCGERPIHPELTRYCLPCTVRARELKRKRLGNVGRNLPMKTYRLEAEGQ